ncbi:MAG: hypothetical protein LBR30_01145 [Clostridioides sp.]|jgi:signal transduction histidine kinase|nr:hypothetical protein [Clostridioides sp.]
MKFSRFIRDRIFPISIIIFFALFSAVTISFIQKNFYFSIYITLMIVVIGLCSLLPEYFSKKKYYDELTNILKELDKKYLLSEIIEKADFFEGEIMYDTLRSCSKSMNDEIAKYQISSEEYREYIELWVHEIKTPIAAAKLICENKKNSINTHKYKTYEYKTYEYKTHIINNESKNNSIINNENKNNSNNSENIKTINKKEDTNDDSQNYVSFLKKEDTNDDSQNYTSFFKKEDYQNILEELNRIDFFVEQALFYARSDSIEKDYSIKKVTLEEIVNDAVKKNARHLIANKIGIHKDGLLDIVFTDKKWLEFILRQLIDNSVKYKSKNLYFTHKNNENSISLFIRDDGVGILEKDLHRVFDKGFTGENGRIFGKSTGMGLYLCKKLCLKLGLNVCIYSTYNEGTTIEIVFPVSNVNYDL